MATDTDTRDIVVDYLHALDPAELVELLAEVLGSGPDDEQSDTSDRAAARRLFSQGRA